MRYVNEFGPAARPDFAKTFDPPSRGDSELGRVIEASLGRAMAFVLAQHLRRGDSVHA